MPSYILWQLSQLKWLKTSTNKTVKPTDCCLSKTITDDFSPLIEVPKINYADNLFKSQKISKEDTYYYLTKIGVKRYISSFSTDTIYSMLLNLKDIDKDGKKEKLIYREIVENLDDKTVDLNSVNYINFINTGYVHSRRNSNSSYEPLSAVYYVDNKNIRRGCY